MNEKFVTETNITRKKCYDFVNYVNFYRQWWLYAIIFVLVIILEYMQTHSWQSIILYLLAIAAICYLSNQLSSFILWRRYGKSLKISFFDNNFFAQTAKGREKISYGTIKSITERPHYFYIFFQRGRGAFIIGKNDFKKGNCENFLSFIKEKTEKK